MSERTWIKIHSGLTADPQHRERMGIRVWWFIEAVNRADWETGIVYNYTDPWFAEILQMPESTVRKHRTGLQDEKYIVCHPAFQGLHIRIMRWRDPRKVNPPMTNIPGDVETWCPILDTHPRSKLDTLTILDSHSITPAASIIERHFGVAPTGINADLYEAVAEQFGLDELELACIATVNAGGGHKMRPSYVRAICQRRKDERNGSTTPEDIDSLVAAIAKDAYGE